VWFVIIVAGFELALFGLEHASQTSQSQLVTYFDYGYSIEHKLRVFAQDSELPARHVFNAGWLDLERFPPAGEACDLAVYGNSFAHALSEDIKALRPALKMREFYGPGVPISHSYAAYGMDVERRRARVVMIPLLSDSVPYLRTMTHDTRESDHSQPVTWPRYAVRDDRVVVVGEPVIHSAKDLRRALLEDRGLWQRHLEMLDEHDDYYVPTLYAAHWTEQLASLRLVRRAISHSRAREHRDELIRGAGFIPNTETAGLTRRLLQQYIHDVRDHGEKPIVVLMDSTGEAHFLSKLVGDMLAQEQVAVVRSEDHCDATERANFIGDGHYTDACNHAIAEQFVELLDRSFNGDLALEKAKVTHRGSDDGHPN
jgi:hypothetical protein